MEKRLGVTLRQSYVTKITTILNTSMIPTGTAMLFTDFYSGKQGQEKRFGIGKTKTGMVTANNAAR